jgi:GntR family transcriptional regulator/MocR family aminotransferase
MPGPKFRGASSRRAPDAPVILVPLDASAPSPLYCQLYDGLREAILAGRLTPGARVPSTRVLAADLGVARNTVVLAYDQLRTEGYLEGTRGGGSRVRAAIPDRLLDVGTTRRRRGALAPAPTPNRSSPPHDAERISARGAMLVRAGRDFAQRGGTTPRAFRLGMPALDAFPSRLWARLTARGWRDGDVFLGDGDPLGEPALRDAIANYVTTSRGAHCTADQVFVVNGTQHALDLVARVLLDPGDAAWVEEPGYIGAHAALAAAGARIVPVRVDEHGLDVAAGERASPGARLAYVTPSHQFPLGAVMSAPRRLALLAWARRAGAWIVEDDYDSEFRYVGRPLPCLQGIDSGRASHGESARVLYVGTFNKTLVPGIRLGYLVAPEPLVDSFRVARAATDRHASTFVQNVLADFIAEGHYARHLRRVRALYAERQRDLLDAVEESMPELLTMIPDAAGLHLVGWLPEGMNDVPAAEAAMREGVEVVPLSRYVIGARRPMERGALLLGYAAFDRVEIRDGVRQLRRALAGVT